MPHHSPLDRMTTSRIKPMGWKKTSFLLLAFPHCALGWTNQHLLQTTGPQNKQSSRNVRYGTALYDKIEKSDESRPNAPVSSGEPRDYQQLVMENQLLRETIRVLQDENTRLSLHPAIILETFEGERRWNNVSTWYEPSDCEGDGITDEELLEHENTTELQEGDYCPVEPTIPFRKALRDRAFWLVGLLIMQSLSGLILSQHEQLLANHPVIVFFLTMLVGAGGNAGNQASVRVIRGLALGTLNETTQGQFLWREFRMAGALSIILSLAGFVRAAVFRTPLAETIAITSSLFLIVASSVCLGAILPLFLQRLGVDPAHSSTTIQVVMDILGVVMAVAVSTLILDSPVGHVVFGRLIAN